MLLVDTNVWLAAGDRRSQHHERCATLLRDNADGIVLPVPVIAETAWLLLDRAGPEAQSTFVSMVATGQVEVADLLTADWARVAELLNQYADLRLDVVDAATVAIAERLGITTIATLDHRDFRVVRPAHTEAFELLP